MKMHLSGANILRFSLRTWLFALYLLAMLPLLLFAGYAIVELANKQRTLILGDLAHSSSDVARATDERLNVALTAMHTLAASGAATHSDLPGLYEHAKRIVSNNPLFRDMSVVDANDQMLFHTSRPYGAKTFPPSYLNLVHQVFETGKPSVSGPFLARGSSKTVVAVSMPLYQSGNVAYCLSLILLTDSFNQLLLSQNLPPGWIAAIADGEGTIVARTLDPDKFVGQKGGPAFRDAIRLGGSRMFQGVSMEGVSTSNTLQPLSRGDWYLAIGVPNSTLNAPRQALVLQLLSLAAVWLSLSFLLSQVMARYLSKQLHAVADAVLHASDLSCVKIRVTELWSIFESFLSAKHREDVARSDLTVVSEQRDEITDLYDYAPCGYHSLDRNGRIIRINQTELDWFGYQRKEVMGHQFMDFLTDAGKAVFNENFPKFVALGFVRELALELVRKNGTLLSVVINSTSINDASDHFLMSRSTVFDNTERRQIQAALQASHDLLNKLSAQVPGLFYQFQLFPDGRSCFPYASEGMRTVYGVNPEAVRTDAALVFATLCPDDLDQVHASVQESARTLQPWMAQYRVNLVGRGQRWISGLATPQRLADGSTLWHGYIYDITERKQIQDALQAAKVEAERANNAKSRFLASASHDLRQPLAALSLYIDVLKIKREPPAEKLLTNMSNCVASLSELLTDLLDISKLEAGVVRPEVSEFNVAEMLATLIAVHGPTASDKGLGLRLHRRPSTLYARTDRVLLARILGNILANAIRYTERGGVLIGCRRYAGKTWVEVWDSGMGIPQDKIGEIFEEYRQLHQNSRNRGTGAIGSGLGLAIVAKTAALLGLEVRVQSRLGHGSMFAVELPLGDGEDVVKRIEGLQETTHKALRIALVDNDAAVLDALSSALRGIGNEVVPAASGQALLRLLDNVVPQVVITDYRLLDGETGLDVIATLRRTFGEKLPAIIITGDTDPDFLRCMAAQSITVQHKPLQMDILQIVIRSAIAHSLL